MFSDYRMYSLTGIFLVALGTSLPDTFASIIAIREDDNADNAVGNVTGSNSVNVFLGLGVCVRVCVCVCVCVFMCVYVCTHTHARARAHTHTHFDMP